MSEVPLKALQGVPTFLEFAPVVLDQREEDGIHGVARERSRFRVHIAPAAFAAMSLEEGVIEPRHIADWLREMSSKQPADKRGPRKLSRATIQRSQALLSVIFNEAIERGYRKTNPCSNQKLKRRAGEEATRETWAFLTLDEQQRIAACEAIPKHDRLAIQFAFWTGLRQGEQRHLEIADIHLDAPDPHVVVRYASLAKDGTKRPPKSGKTRRVPLLPEAQVVVREWLELLPKFAPHNPHNLVFPTARGSYRSEGKPLGRSSVLQGYYKAAGIELRPYLHWHALRHTFCSSLVSGAWGRRWTLEEVRVVAGHSSVLITQRYSHHGADVIAQAARETVVSEAPAANSVFAEGASRVRQYVWRALGRVRALRDSAVRISYRRRAS